MISQHMNRLAAFFSGRVRWLGYAQALGPRKNIVRSLAAGVLLSLASLSPVQAAGQEVAEEPTGKPGAPLIAPETLRGLSAQYFIDQCRKELPRAEAGAIEHCLYNRWMDAQYTAGRTDAIDKWALDAKYAVHLGACRSQNKVSKSDSRLTDAQRSGMTECLEDRAFYTKAIWWGGAGTVVTLGLGLSGWAAKRRKKKDASGAGPTPS